MSTFEQPLFGCFSDLTTTCITCCLPFGTCYVQASAVDRATKEGISIPCAYICLLSCFGAAINRTKIRKNYDYSGNYLKDCLFHTFCMCCAIIQEFREVAIREG